MSTNTIYAHSCQFCDFKSDKIKKYNSHIKICSNNPENFYKKFKCIECNYSYETNANLIKHKNTCKHNNEKELKKCDHCEFTSYSNSGITIHTNNCKHNPINTEKHINKIYSKNKDIEVNIVYRQLH